MIVLLWATAAVVVDAGSKAVVGHRLVEGRLYAAAPGYGVRLVRNQRAALTVTETAGVLGAVVAVVFAAAPHGLAAVGLGLALGGASGNLLDRTRGGAVVDFIAAGRWPVFNLADAAMTVGLVLAAVSVL